MFVNIFLGSLVLSLVHNLIPNHWMPIVVIGKAERWDIGKLRKVAAVAGLAHSLSTVLIGVVVGLMGLQLTAISLNSMRLVGPSVFFLIGILYLIGGIRDNLRHHPHRHIHLHEALQNRSRAATTSIAVSMFFSPCLEIETYFFSASVAGWMGIGLVSITYTVITVAGMLIFVSLGRRGLENVKLHFFEHYDRHIMGLILMITAVLFYFFLE